MAEPFKEPLESLRFIGNWEVAAREDSRDNRKVGDSIGIKYDSSAPVPFKLTGWGSSRISLQYETKTDTLITNNGRFKIAFWRNPAVDMIFAVHSDKAVFTARRKSAKVTAPSPTSVSVDGQGWVVTMNNGPHVPPVGHHVYLRQMDFQNRNMFGLFVQDPTKRSDESLYDLVYYSETGDSFFSVFGVRSIKIWKSGGPDQKGLLFATYDHHFATPTGYMRDPAGPVGLGEPGDPDAGCWCGKPLPPS